MDTTTLALARSQADRLMKAQFALSETSAGIEPDPRKSWFTRVSQALAKRVAPWPTLRSQSK
jgi:hypothetical protein